MTLPDPGVVGDLLPADPPMHRLRPGERLVRIYHPRHGEWFTRRRFGPLDDMRFDHHPPPCGEHEEEAVWYSSVSLVGAVAEVFGRQRLIDREAGQGIAVARVEKPLEVLDLLGVSARQLELTQEIATSMDYASARAWAREFYRRYRGLQGIRWRGRQSGSICVLLDDRAAGDGLSARHWPLTDLDVWPRIARAARACRIGVV